MMYLFVLGRILFGGYFMMSGYKHFKSLEMLTGYAKGKGIPMPRESVLLTGLMMLLGGLGILLGAFVELSVFLLAVFLIGTLFKMHRYWEVADPTAKMGEQINFFKNLALLGALLMMLAIPMPWVVSLVF